MLAQRTSATGILLSDSVGHGDASPRPGLANIYLHARYYDSALGIFLSPDPANADRNTYRYSLGDPVNLSDPSGLDPLNCGGPQQLPCNEDVLVTAWAPRRRPTSNYWLSGPSLIVEGFEDILWERQQQKVAAREEARENWRTRFGTGNDNRDPKCTANCDGKGTGNTDSGNRAAVEEMRKQQNAAVEKELERAIPVCGGGAFGFVGFSGEFGMKYEALALGGYDSEEGWSNSALGALVFPGGLSLGLEQVAPVAGPDRTEIIGFGHLGGSRGATRAGQMLGRSVGDHGVFVQPHSFTEASVGFYSSSNSRGGRTFGGGAYLNINLGGCSK